jgi:riboflavin kinase/FMN adenylyltransferase
VKIYHHINEFEHQNKSVITTGTFDGVHIGHQKILEKLIETAKIHQGESVLLTFHPHPRLVLQNDRDLKLIQTMDEKIAALEKIGLDHLIIHPFTKAFSQLSSSDFIHSVLIEQLGAKRLVIGYDHQFGKNREGSFAHLKKYASNYQFEVEEISAKDLNEVTVSSTKIRNAILAGEIKQANEYLTRSYELHGKVAHGAKIGRTLGVPTANISEIDRHKILPKEGAYFVKVLHENKSYFGMLNIGFKPTLDQSQKQSIEVHIFDFQGDLYDQSIEVLFLERIRDEKKFPTLEALKKQLSLDKAWCLERID